jgi:hypothetical protein
MAVRVMSGSQHLNKLDSRALTAAKINLASCAVVGFTDRYRDFASHLRFLLGWDINLDNIPVENVGPEKLPIPSRQLEEALSCEALALDLELYRWAKEHF